MLSPSVQSTLRIRPIASAARSVSSALHQGPKAIVLAGSVLSVVSCPHRRLLSEGLSCLDQYDGWMWQAERFAGLGRPIGAASMSRSLRSSRSLSVFFLPSALLVWCVRITV